MGKFISMPPLTQVTVSAGQESTLPSDSVVWARWVAVCTGTKKNGIDMEARTAEVTFCSAARSP